MSEKDVNAMLLSAVRRATGGVLPESVVVLIPLGFGKYSLRDIDLAGGNYRELSIKKQRDVFAERPEDIRDMLRQAPALMFLLQTPSFTWVAV